MPVITDNPTFDALPDVCTLGQVARFFQTKESTIRKWRRDGLIRSIEQTKPMKFPKHEIGRRLHALTPIDAF